MLFTYFLPKKEKRKKTNVWLLDVHWHLGRSCITLLLRSLMINPNLGLLTTYNCIVLLFVICDLFASISPRLHLLQFGAWVILKWRQQQKPKSRNAGCWHLLYGTTTIFSFCSSTFSLKTTFHDPKISFESAKNRNKSFCCYESFETRAYSRMLDSLIPRWSGV